jgi:DNA-directed RNA polymerase specialized sigma24 family protein
MMTVIAHGYTLTDADRIAGRAARQNRSGLLSQDDRHRAALDAVTDLLLTASTAPAATVLHRAAFDAISRAVETERHHLGLPARESGSPRFARFWYQPHLPFEEELTDCIAVGQVIAGIRPGQRRDLEALAEHGTYEAAARALGTTVVTFRSRLSKARAAAAELWFSPEVAPGDAVRADEGPGPGGA